MGCACRPHGRDEKCLKIFVGKPEGKRPLGELGADGMVISEWILRK